MPDISSLPGRRTAQRRITNNRDGVLPSKRDTELPGVAIRGDMRTAFRGDTSEELRRALGMATTAAGNFLEAREANKKDQYAQEAAKGSLDAAGGGDADPGMAKSSPYQEAYYGVRAEARFNEFATSIQQRADELLAQGADPEEVQQEVMKEFQTFTQDVTDTIPTASAKLATGKRLSSFAGKLQADLSEKIKARTDQELVDTHTGNIQARLKSGQPVSFEADVDTLRQAGIPPQDAKRRVIEAVAAVALDRESPDPELLEQLLGSKQADGKTPSLSAAEQLAVQDRITQARSLAAQRDREAHEDAQKDYEKQWYSAALNGENRDVEIDSAVERGVFTPQEGIAWRNAMQGLRTDTENGDANEGLVLDFQLELADEKKNPQTIRQRIVDAYNGGQLGTGLDAKRAYVQLMGHVYNRIDAVEAKARAAANRSPEGKIEKAAGRAALAYFNSVAKPASFDGQVSREDAQRYAMDSMELTRRIASGEDPMAAANAILDRRKGPAKAGQPAKKRVYNPTTNQLE